MREGEIVPLVLSFTSSAAERYWADKRDYDRSGRLNIETYCVEPGALIMAATVIIAVGVTMTAWRLMLALSAPRGGIPEQMLFAAGTFVAFCGSGPLAISAAIMGITRQDGPVGPAFVGALAPVAASASLYISESPLRSCVSCFMRTTEPRLDLPQLTRPGDYTQKPPEAQRV